MPAPSIEESANRFVNRPGEGVVGFLELHLYSFSFGYQLFYLFRRHFTRFCCSVMKKSSPAKGIGVRYRVSRKARSAGADSPAYFFFVFALASRSSFAFRFDSAIYSRYSFKEFSAWCGLGRKSAMSQSKIFASSFK